MCCSLVLSFFYFALQCAVLYCGVRAISFYWLENRFLFLPSKIFYFLSCLCVHVYALLLRDAILTSDYTILHQRLPFPHPCIHSSIHTSIHSTIHPYRHTYIHSNADRSILHNHLKPLNHYFIVTSNFVYIHAPFQWWFDHLWIIWIFFLHSISFLNFFSPSSFSTCFSPSLPISPTTSYVNFCTFSLTRYLPISASFHPYLFHFLRFFFSSILAVYLATPSAGTLNNYFETCFSYMADVTFTAIFFCI